MDELFSIIFTEIIHERLVFILKLRSTCSIFTEVLFNKSKINIKQIYLHPVEISLNKIYERGQLTFGIDDISFYVPSLYLDIEDLAQARGIEPSRLKKGLD